MNFLITLIIFGVCFAAMAIGLIISKKVLQKGCSVNPEDCKCAREGIDPKDCDQEPRKQTQP